MPTAARSKNANPQEQNGVGAPVRARYLLAENRITEAYDAYLELLRDEPTNRAALHELGCLAYANDFRSAARTAFEQLVSCWPQDIVGRTNLANILYEFGEFSAAESHFAAALRIDSECADAHRGLGRILRERGETEAADHHWRRSFRGQAIATQLYRGKAPPIRVLMLVSASGGNIPTQHLLDDRVFAVSALYTEYYKPELAVVPHDVVFNAIGDTDLCPEGLETAVAIVRRLGKPVINLPCRVQQTGRAANTVRLGRLADVRSPRFLRLPRTSLAEAKSLGFPLLLRSPGFHAGMNFLRVEAADELMAAAQRLPGEDLFAIEYLDARGADGMARKYRVMTIGGKLYPTHLAISQDWKVHYFTANMSESAAHRAEEKEFLENMPRVLGPKAMVALASIAKELGLDYAGIDFALNKDGSIALFEANATMVINPVGPESLWDYRREAIDNALAATRNLVQGAAAGP